MILVEDSLGNIYEAGILQFGDGVPVSDLNNGVILICQCGSLPPTLTPGIPGTEGPTPSPWEPEIPTEPGTPDPGTDAPTGPPWGYECPSAEYCSFYCEQYYTATITTPPDAICCEDSCVGTYCWESSGGCSWGAARVYCGCTTPCGCHHTDIWCHCVGDQCFWEFSICGNDSGCCAVYRKPADEDNCPDGTYTLAESCGGGNQMPQEIMVGVGEWDDCPTCTPEPEFPTICVGGCIAEEQCANDCEDCYAVVIPGDPATICHDDEPTPAPHNCDGSYLMDLDAPCYWTGIGPWPYTENGPCEAHLYCFPAGANSYWHVDVEAVEGGGATYCRWRKESCIDEFYVECPDDINRNGGLYDYDAGASTCFSCYTGTITVIKCP